MIGWVAAILTLVAGWLLGRKSIGGWPVGIAGNVLWIVSEWGNWPLVVLNTTFLFVYVAGWRRWRAEI